MPKFPIVGMSHRFPANAVLGYLPPDTSLFMVREPDNQHDPNAIQVWVTNPHEAFGDEEVEDSIRALCTEQEKAAPDFTKPLMLGYIKATTINDDNLGADQLAPRIDAMVSQGEIGEAKEIPAILVYGSTGRPALAIVTPAGDADEPEPEEDDSDEVGEDFTSEEHE